MSTCENCPTPDNCTDCVNIEIAEISDATSAEVTSFEVDNPQTFEAQSNEFQPAPPIVRLIHTLGNSAQAIHDMAKEMHPGDAGICVALAAQIGAVAQMFVDAVNSIEAEAQADQNEVTE